MSCCRKSAGFDPKVMQRIRQKMAVIQDIFPGTSFVALLTPDGEVL
jgi:hypothetical protein